MRFSCLGSIEGCPTLGERTHDVPGATRDSPHSRTALSSMRVSPPGERERQRDRSGHGLQGGSVSSPDDHSRRAVGQPALTATGWAPIGISSITRVAATVVRQNPNVNGVLGDRGVSFQIPLPRLFWLHPGILDACISTRRGRAQEADPSRSSYGTFMAHKSEKPWSAR
jgi:hypothetical protein